VGPGILLRPVASLQDLPIRLHLMRAGETVFEGETNSSQIKRPFPELVDYLCRETSFPAGAFLMTGTGIIPPMEFSLQRGDTARITIGDLTLENRTAMV
jgi:2-dehydro-3-deoxy-D-arabinonate dehydratase